MTLQEQALAEIAIYGFTIVFGAKAPQGVVVFEGKAGRVEQIVTGRAAGGPSDAARCWAELQVITMTALCAGHL